MSINSIVELNNIVADGFLINDIISLIEKENYAFNEEEKRLLNREALRYINSIKEGQGAVRENKLPPNLEKALNAYRIAINSLRESDRDLTLINFNNIITNSEKEIRDSIKKGKIEKLNSANFLFTSIRKYLIKESQKIINKEKTLFKEL